MLALELAVKQSTGRVLPQPAALWGADTCRLHVALRQLRTTGCCKEAVQCSERVLPVCMPEQKSQW